MLERIKDKKPKMINEKNKIKIIVNQDVYRKENTLNTTYYFSTPKELDKFCENLEKNQTIKEQLKNGDGEFSLFSIQLDNEASKKYAKVVQQVDLLHTLIEHLFFYSSDNKAFDLHLLNNAEIALMNRKYSFARPLGNKIDLKSYRNEKYSLKDKQNTEISIHDISLYHINKVIKNLDETIKIYKDIIEITPQSLVNKLKQKNASILSAIEEYMNMQF